MYDVITIGTATRDIFFGTHDVKRLKDARHLKSLGFVRGEAVCLPLGGKTEADEFYATTGGGAVNAAVTFARQGFKTAALVKIGNDESGRAIRERFRAEGIASLAVTHPTEPTGHSVVLLAGGDRSILTYRGAAEELRERDMRPAHLKAKWAYIAPSNIPFAVMRAAATVLKQGGTRIALNPSRAYLELGAEKLKPLLNKADVVFVNEEEASLLTGIPYGKGKAIFRALDEMVRGIVVMTRGRAGAALSDGSFVYRTGIYADSGAVDRTGAGDAFGAGFVAGLMAAEDMTHALKLASANAAAVVARIGASEGALRAREFPGRRFTYLDLDIEPLLS